MLASHIARLASCSTSGTVLRRTARTAGPDQCRRWRRTHRRLRASSASVSSTAARQTLEKAMDTFSRELLRKK